MNRRAYWRVTMRYWPEAAKAGVRPVEAHGFGLNNEDWKPEHYKSHSVDFDNIPSRDDLLTVIAETPWMICFQKDGLVDAVKANPWPFVTPGHKAANIDLFDDKGVQVGEINVNREWSYTNKIRHIPAVWIHHIDDVVCRLGKRRQEARKLLCNSRTGHEIVDRMEKAELDSSDENVTYMLRLYLHEKGILKTKPSKPRQVELV